MKDPDWKTLAAAARRAARHAHCPYSRFRVGAALLAADGRLFTGANIENASYGLTVCAERVALWKAVSEGARRFVALALAAGGSAPATPCGACLQTLSEFCPPSMPIRCVTLPHGAGAATLALSLAEALPRAFKLAVTSRKS